MAFIRIPDGPILPVRRHQEDNALDLATPIVSFVTSLARNLFALSRNGSVSPVVRLAFARFWRLMPVRRVMVTDEVFAFHHPRPSWTTHILIVPKRGIAGLMTLGTREAPYLAAILATARELALSLDAESPTLTINGGAWQDVGQMHAHLAAGDNVFRPNDPERQEGGVTMHPRPARRFHAVITPPSPLPSPGATDFVIEAVQRLVREYALAPAGFAIVVDPYRLTPVHLISGASEDSRQ